MSACKICKSTTSPWAVAATTEFSSEERVAHLACEATHQFRRVRKAHNYISVVRAQYRRNVGTEASALLLRADRFFLAAVEQWVVAYALQVATGKVQP